MPSKSDQILTAQAKMYADVLKAEGWRQKDYLSAGVIALAHASRDDQARYRAMAIGKPAPITEFVMQVLCRASDDELTQLRGAIESFFDEVGAEQLSGGKTRKPHRRGRR